MRLLVANCSIRYEGRLTTTLAEGDRVILLKRDGSVVVHSGATGAKPVNYMPGPTAVHEEDGGLVVHRTDTGEMLHIELHSVHSDLEYEAEDEAKLQRIGNEKDVQEVVFANVEAIEEGMIPIERERFTDVGPVDLFCRDGNDQTCVIEIKRVKAVAQAVEQLKRYVDEVDRNAQFAPARGILLAPELAPQARVLMEKYAFDYICLDDVLERCGDSEASLSLF